MKSRMALVVNVSLSKLLFIVLAFLMFSCHNSDKGSDVEDREQLSRNLNMQKEGVNSSASKGPNKSSDVSKDSANSNDHAARQYTSVPIGKQLWMKENLNVSRFRNGDSILEAKTEIDWEVASDEGKPVWCYYKNKAVNNPTYGKLYNWYAVADPRHLCPIGWHVPSDAEFTVLTDYLGGELVAGGKMKASTLWAAPSQMVGYKGSQADNSSGFTALPAGCCGINGDFGNLGYGGYLWSSTEKNSPDAGGLWMYADGRDVRPINTDKRNGRSVRCVRD